MVYASSCEYAPYRVPLLANYCFSQEIHVQLGLQFAAPIVDWIHAHMYMYRITKPFFNCFSYSRGCVIFETIHSFSHLLSCHCGVSGSRALVPPGRVATQPPPLAADHNELLLDDSWSPRFTKWRQGESVMSVLGCKSHLAQLHAYIYRVLREALGFNQKAGDFNKVHTHSSEALRGPSAFRLYRLDEDLSGVGRNL